MRPFVQRVAATVLWLALASNALAGCAQLRDEMRYAQQSYDRERYEDALVWLSDLEDDLPEMDRRMRARFYFLRGMTAYHLQQRDDALHYLALAREEVTLAKERNARRAVLPPEWSEELNARLNELTPTERGAFHARPDGAAGSGGEQPPSSGS